MSFRRSLSIIKNIKNSLYILGVYLILIGLNDVYSKGHQVALVSPTPTAASVLIQTAIVTKVFDGDTIQVSTGEKVRYIGMDTTEVYPVVRCFSEEAKKANEDLVLGKEVRLEKDVSESDKYDRLLRYVFVDNIFVNDKLVRDGYAKVATYPPDVKYQQVFLDSERFARENNLGLWSSCKSL